MMSRRQVLLLSGLGTLGAFIENIDDADSSLVTRRADSEALSRRVSAALSALDTDSLIGLSMDLCNIPNPLGSEDRIASFLQRRMQEAGLESRLQSFAPNRSNVLGKASGSGGGKSLMFVGHLESGPGPQEVNGAFPKPMIDGEWIRGVGIWNMKGALASYVAAVSAVRKAGLDLAGDVLIAGVAGTHDQTVVETKIKGGGIQGYSIGTMHLLSQGILADMCIVGEPTSFRIVRQHFGMTAVRIDIIVNESSSEEIVDLVGLDWPTTDAVEFAAETVQTLRKWIADYKERNKLDGVPPWVFMSGIEGGAPWSPYPSMKSSVFLYVGTLPQALPTSALDEIRAALAPLLGKHPDLQLHADVFFREPGPLVSNNSPIVTALRASHMNIFGAEPPMAVVPWHSDASPLTRFGIPSVNYGPAGKIGPTPDRKRWSEAVRIPDLVNCARVYIDLIVRVCSNLER